MERNSCGLYQAFGWWVWRKTKIPQSGQLVIHWIFNWVSWNTSLEVANMHSIPPSPTPPLMILLSTFTRSVSNQKKMHIEVFPYYNLRLCTWNIFTTLYKILLFLHSNYCKDEFSWYVEVSFLSEWFYVDSTSNETEAPCHTPTFDDVTDFSCNGKSFHTLDI
jgi:hypothetical protein